MITTTIDIKNNDSAIRVEYDLYQPIEVLFHQIEMVVEFNEVRDRNVKPTL